MAATAQPRHTYQIKVTLKGARPPIWRRLRVRSDITLAGLHAVIQCALNWHDTHLHLFLHAGQEYGAANIDSDYPSIDERRVRLDHLLGAPKDKMLYVYDFGDDWQHEVLLEQVLPADDGTAKPVCVTGRRARPPEDVGGVWGYTEFLEAIGDPEHPEHESMLEWVGGEFDPERFDSDEVNGCLARLKGRG